MRMAGQCDKQVSRMLAAWERCFTAAEECLHLAEPDCQPSQHARDLPVALHTLQTLQHT